MSRSNSGRIVLEINPCVKDNLYIALAKNKLTLKDWFLIQCDEFIKDSLQPHLFNEMVAEASIEYKGKVKE